MLTAEDPLPQTPRRIVVAGVSGAGKTTFATRIDTATGIPHTELDALFHGPAWTPRPQFEADVRALIAQDAWVTEWSYGVARPLLAEAADLLVWLDFPFWRVTFPRVVRRTVRRRIRREVLWNGNREGPLADVFRTPEHILRWSVTTRHTYAQLVPHAAARFPHLTVVRLATPAEAAAWIAGPLTSARG